MAEGNPVVLMREGPTGVSHGHGPVRNPFRNHYLKAQFDAIVGAYDRRHKDVVRLDRDGRYRRHMGNSWANSFWRGFDNVVPGRWDAASKQTPAYACWRAGQALRRALPELARSANEEPLAQVGFAEPAVSDVSVSTPENPDDAGSPGGPGLS